MRRPGWSLLGLLAVFPLPAFQSGPAVRASAELLSGVVTLMQEGRYPEAFSRLERAPGRDPHVLRLRLELAERSGNLEQASLHAERLLQLYHAGQLQGGDEVGQAAFAAWRLDRWQEANQIFMEASKLDPVTVSLHVDWGNLYLEKYNAAEAESIFHEGIDLGESDSGYQRWGIEAGWVGLAQALRDQFNPSAAEALSRARELNPDSLPGHVLAASLALEESNWKEAEKEIRAGLDLNPRFLPLLELQCALHYFQQQAGPFEASRQKVLQINPRDGDLFERLGDLAVIKRRLEEALGFYQEAIRRNPRQWSALASLGINLLRLGREAEGKEMLERAYAHDPFNIWTVNTLRLLDSFDRFVRFETPHFRVKLDKKESAALRPYVEKLLERSLNTLEQKYRHQVDGRYVFEMYSDHEDFAVRTLGLPGLGALGATFGRVVAMDSPSARPQGQFHWASTLWHEMAHVVTLSLSEDKVPRWFTEGIAMMEERQAGEGWGEYLTPAFVSAYEKDELAPLSELDAGFQRPKSVQHLAISYFQAGWVCEFLVARHGFEKMAAMLSTFGEGHTTPEVFEQILGESVEEVDRLFRQQMDEVLKPLVNRLKIPDELQSVPASGSGPSGAGVSLEALMSAWTMNPDNYYVNLQLGQRLKREGRLGEALPHLEKALEIFPTYAAQDSPYALLAEIYEETGETEKALQIRRRWWKMSPRFTDNALQLASLLAERDQTEEAAAYLEQNMYLDPLQPEPHQNLGELYLKLGKADEATREFRVLLELDPVDRATAHYNLARALLKADDLQGARRQVLLALEIAPSFEGAQQLLLEVVSR